MQPDAKLSERPPELIPPGTFAPWPMAPGAPISWRSGGRFCLYLVREAPGDRYARQALEADLDRFHVHPVQVGADAVRFAGAVHVFAAEQPAPVDDLSTDLDTTCAAYAAETPVAWAVVTRDREGLLMCGRLRDRSGEARRFHAAKARVCGDWRATGAGGYALAGAAFVPEPSPRRGFPVPGR